MIHEVAAVKFDSPFGVMQLMFFHEDFEDAMEHQLPLRVEYSEDDSSADLRTPTPGDRGLMAFLWLADREKAERRRVTPPECRDWMLDFMRVRYAHLLKEDS